MSGQSGGMRPSAVDDRLATLSDFYSFALDRKAVRANPVPMVRRLRGRSLVSTYRDKAVSGRLRGGRQKPITPPLGTTVESDYGTFTMLFVVTGVSETSATLRFAQLGDDLTVPGLTTALTEPSPWTVVARRHPDGGFRLPGTRASTLRRAAEFGGRPVFRFQRLGRSCRPGWDHQGPCGVRPGQAGCACGCVAGDRWCMELSSCDSCGHRAFYHVHGTCWHDFECTCSDGMWGRIPYSADNYLRDLDDHGMISLLSGALTSAGAERFWQRVRSELT